MASPQGIVRIKARHVFVAGAASEIGRRLVPALAAEGSRLTLLGEDAAALARLARQAEQAGARCLVIPYAGAPAAAPALVRKATDRFGPIDCLVNAGAVARCERVAQAPDGSAGDMLQSNLADPIRLTQAVLPGMLRRRRGRIVNVGSIFGAVGVPGLAIYAASMFGLRGFSEALRRELAGSGVSVVYVAPRHAHGAEEEEAIGSIAAGLGLDLDLDGSTLAAAAALAAVEGCRATDGAWPERLIGPLNAACPALVDRAVARRRRRMRVAGDASVAQPAGEVPPGAEAGRVIPIHPLPIRPLKGG
jgi:short-subunit dehydrogenase